MTVQKTVPVVNLRRFERFPCSQATVLRALPSGSFRALKVQVKDVSPKGIGLLCEPPIENGILLALQWHFGEPDQWRTVLARVVRVVPQKGGEQLLLGCEIGESLSTEEIQALRDFSAPQTRSLLHPLEFLKRMGFAVASS